MRNLIKGSLVLFVAILLISCDEEDLLVPPDNDTVMVQFINDLSILENVAEKEVEIQFSKAVAKSGSLTIGVDTDFAEHFNTTPQINELKIIVPFDKGAEKAFFKIAPVNNNLLDQERIVSFEIKDVSQGLVVGDKKKIDVTIIDDEVPVYAGFSLVADSVMENSSSSYTVTINFSGPVPDNGTIAVLFNESNLLSEIVTSPPYDSNGKILLQVTKEAVSTSFAINYSNNELLESHKALSFHIAETWGSVVVGEKQDFKFKILDDELLWKPKSYETIGGGWRSKNTYEYDQLGRISKILWETETPLLQTGTKTYYYADNGLIVKINYFPNNDEIFIQENGKIVRSEEVHEGIVKSYKLYDYDEAGNVGAVALYNRQPSGEYVNSLIYVYLYFTNGNLYKQLIYTPVEGSEEHTLISTKTYDNYLNVDNPFSAIEVLPNHNAQPKLPSSYRIEENGVDLKYSFTYDFIEGKPIKRTTTGGSGSEMTYYKYY